MKIHPSRMCQKFTLHCVYTGQAAAFKAVILKNGLILNKTKLVIYFHSAVNYATVIYLSNIETLLKLQTYQQN